MENLVKPLTALDVAQMIDISAVRTDSTDQKILEMVNVARKYHCYLVTILPPQTLRTKALLQQYPDAPKLGGNVGLPSGGHTTAVKVKEARELVTMGVDEIDMVIDVAAHLSGRYDDVYRDMAAVVEAADGKPVKIILECYYLNDTQIRIGCDLAIKAGARFVKTGTGWAPSGATLENIALIKQHVGDAVKIKASGGVRGIESLLEMYRRGASRFGISASSAAGILDQLESLPQPIVLR